jgi:phosphopantothenoylcysteine decarboxylase/phosphopantothenate--cysteine ligase
MAEAVQQEVKNASVFIAAAAVADYRPKNVAEQKIKKSDQTITLTLERTTDILAQVAASRTNGLIVIGFAAETENLLANAQQKLSSKNLDAVVANDVSRTGAGFDTPTNAVTIVTKDKVMELPLMAKTAVADRVLDVASELRNKKPR